ncbi:MAG: 4-hydroxythreonine-4-phosphate dehydrogenase PdxA, partial [Candidatus Omnitrophica bacterium]|nr:4-hydroxythreonine-4-phosphate dehydrogenase PdxA [Candidatus Omnitrophota bacterium]
DRAMALTGIKIKLSAKGINLYDLKNVEPKNFSFGKISGSYGRASIEYIDKAISLIRSKKSDILVTAPINKHAAGLSGFKYSGHTGYLAERSDTKDYAMMLAGGPLKVILVTTHIPLRKVAKSINTRKIFDKIVLTDRYFKKYFGKKSPKIAVSGLNPHAGEDGLLGVEDRELIAPAIRAAKKKKINAFGPLVPDALFYDLFRGDYDAAVCMYHDQGLIPLKMIARDESVNITLGLPFIRTSPGHGTALDIAKRAKASSMSMEEAIKTAVRMFKNSYAKRD